ncbi:hypothetical protein [Streptomyces sp. H27-D2]|uniref:hypothetical protein n=1 Tax=Streptomyces sp. H27-D2 TaxID=3046304 RepID=UPI002DB57D79|nr:hypothetical protein [Streptomyces sp. H27-D2]MEC4019473.1 hypothetical protein [Streptomyces sp. H27-D2]
MTTPRAAARAAVTAMLAAALLGGAGQAYAGQAPTVTKSPAATKPPTTPKSPTTPKYPAASSLAAAREAAAAPAARETLSRFFARDGAVTRAAAAPRIEGATVPVYVLSPAFVAGAPTESSAVPVAELEFFASEAVASDGQRASVWTVRTDGAWKVVNIATGDDATRYAARGASAAGGKGGTVFQEPQINAWYVQRGERVLPLDADAKRAVGVEGGTLDAFRARVHKAYGDKLPGSAYDRKREAGGYGSGPAAGVGTSKSAEPAESAAAPRSPGSSRPVRSPEQASATPEGLSGDSGLLTVASTAAGAAALVALTLSGMVAIRRRRGDGRD